MNDLAALQLPAICWAKHHPSHDVLQREHAPLFIKCSDVNASVAQLTFHLLEMEVKE